MNWKVLMCVLAASLLSGSMFAQMGGEEGGDDGDDVSDDVSYFLEAYDGNSDGTVTKAELKAASDKDAGDASETDKLQAYGGLLMEYLAADANDDESLTKDELTAYFKASNAGKKGKLSAKDWKTLEADYLEPDMNLTLKQYDKDGDKGISKEEAKAIEDFPLDDFDKLDGNKDGKLTIDEYKAYYKKMMANYYDIEGAAATDTTKSEITPEMREKAKAAFAKWDTDGDGFCTKAEFKALQTDEASAHWWGRYIGFLVIDADDDLKISLDEMIASGMASKAGEKGKIYPVDEKEACNEVWLTLDGDKDGKVIAAEFKKIFPTSDEFPGADTDKSGDLSKQEFWNLLKPSLTDSFEFVDKDKTTSGAKDGDKTGDGDGESNSAEDNDVWALYKKKGRTWTWKLDTGGMAMWVKYEVIEVADDHAKVRVSNLDKDGKAFMGMVPTETDISFTKSDAQGEMPEGMKKVEKTIKVEAGEFECVGYQQGDEEVQFWMLKKFPGLLVKSDNMELTAFTE